MENELWANSMRTCVAQDLQRALDATLKRLEVVEETDLRVRWVEQEYHPDWPTDELRRAVLEEKT